MSLFVWIVLGLLAGFIASHIVNRHGERIVPDIVLGIVGAIVGGWLFHMLGYAGVSGLNLAPTGNINSGSFGFVTDARSPRIGQVALKLLF